MHASKVTSLINFLMNVNNKSQQNEPDKEAYMT